jgi:hypothetical protein
MEFFGLRTYVREREGHAALPNGGGAWRIKLAKRLFSDERAGLSLFAAS